MTQQQQQQRVRQQFPAYTEGFGGLSVNLISFHQHPFKTFWDWYKQTWYSLRDVEFDENNTEHIKACYDVLNKKALPVPMELLTLEIEIRGLSRVALAQITRTRFAQFVVCSQMPEYIEHDVIIPTAYLKDEKLSRKAKLLTWLSQELYDEAYNAGIPPQDCRYLTLHSQTTSLRMSINVMALFGFYAFRAENAYTDELNLFCRLLRRELKIKTAGILGWEPIIDKLDGLGANKVCLCYDRVYGNIGRSPSVSDEIPSLINEENPCDYDFSKSSWYYELLDLPEDLLFPGEKEMIDAWKTVGFVERLRQLENKA